MRKTIVLRSVVLIAVGVLLGSLTSGGTSPVGAASKKADPKVQSFCTQLAEPQNSYGPCSKGKSVFTILPTTFPSWLSAAIGTDGFPVMSFGGNNPVTTNDDLDVVHCTDIACGNGKAVMNVVDTTAQTGWTALAVGTDGFPVIAYQDDTTFPNSRVKVAKCNDVACKGGDETITAFNTPAGSGSDGAWISIALGTDGNPIISYSHRVNATDVGLRVTKCDDPACSGSGELTTDLDTEIGGFVRHTSVAVGRSGEPVISYSAENALADGRLKVAACSNAACTSAAIRLVDDQTDYVGQFTAIAIGLDDNPVIASINGDNGDVRVTKCTDPTCGAGLEPTTVVDSPGIGTDGTQIALAANGSPVISYDANGALKAVRCNDPGCIGSDETVLTVDRRQSHTLGQNNSINIGIDRDPVIAYSDSQNALLVARVPG